MPSVESKGGRKYSSSSCGPRAASASHHSGSYLKIWKKRSVSARQASSVGIHQMRPAPRSDRQDGNSNNISKSQRSQSSNARLVGDSPSCRLHPLTADKITGQTGYTNRDKCDVSIADDVIAEQPSNVHQSTELEQLPWRSPGADEDRHSVGPTKETTSNRTTADTDAEHVIIETTVNQSNDVTADRDLTPSCGSTSDYGRSAAEFGKAMTFSDVQPCSVPVRQDGGLDADEELGVSTQERSSQTSTSQLESDPKAMTSTQLYVSESNLVSYVDRPVPPERPLPPVTVESCSVQSVKATRFKSPLHALHCRQPSCAVVDRPRKSRHNEDLRRLQVHKQHSTLMRVRGVVTRTRTEQEQQSNKTEHVALTVASTECNSTDPNTTDELKLSSTHKRNTTPQLIPTQQLLNPEDVIEMHLQQSQLPPFQHPTQIKSSTSNHNSLLCHKHSEEAGPPSTATQKKRRAISNAKRTGCVTASRPNFVPPLLVEQRRCRHESPRPRNVATTPRMRSETWPMRTHPFPTRTSEMRRALSRMTPRTKSKLTSSADSRAPLPTVMTRSRPASRSTHTLDPMPSSTFCHPSISTPVPTFLTNKRLVDSRSPNECRQHLWHCKDERLHRTKSSSSDAVNGNSGSTTGNNGRTILTSKNRKVPSIKSTLNSSSSPKKFPPPGWNSSSRPDRFPPPGSPVSDHSRRSKLIRRTKYGPGSHLKYYAGSPPPPLPSPQRINSAKMRLKLGLESPRPNVQLGHDTLSSNRDSSGQPVLRSMTKTNDDISSIVAVDSRIPRLQQLTETSCLKTVFRPPRSRSFRYSRLHRRTIDKVVPENILCLPDRWAKRISESKVTET